MLLVARQRPAIKSWKSSLLRERETMEIESVGLGNVDLRTLSDVDDEGFLPSQNEVPVGRFTDIFSSLNESVSMLKEVSFELSMY